MITLQVPKITLLPKIRCVFEKMGVTGEREKAHKALPRLNTGI